MAYQLMGELNLAHKHQKLEIELIKTTDDSTYLMMAYSRLMFIELDMEQRLKAYETGLKVARLLEEAMVLTKASALGSFVFFIIPPVIINPVRNTVSAA